jgi:hypothetical protein
MRVEKGITNLVKAADEYGAAPQVVSMARHLAELVEGLGALARRSGDSREQATSLVRAPLFNTELRLQAHGVTVTRKLTADFEAKCSKRLLVATIMNLIDNSIWWLDNKWGPKNKSGEKKLYIERAAISRRARLSWSRTMVPDSMIRQSTWSSRL